MFIRLFVNTNNKDYALEVFSNAIKEIKNYVKKQEIIKTEPYWKIEGVYVIEATIELSELLSDEKLEKFFNSISDKWLYFGIPINEAIASQTAEGCNYIMKDVNMMYLYSING